MKRAMVLVAGLSLALAPLFAGCGSNGNDSGFPSSSGDAAADGTSSGGRDGSLFGDSASGGGDGNMSFGDGGSTCPSTCQELGADCGAVTDTKCGGVIQCGSCEGGAICGGGGSHNVCGGGDGGTCNPETCASQKITCGQAGDGCGNTLTCGSCTMPQTCGGDPTKPGQCSCTGTCQLVPSCPTGTTTTLSGTVLDPAGIHPLYNALVYVPNNPSDPGLQPFPPGITCDVCGSTAAGDPLVTAYTAPDGTFTLSGMPVGPSIPLVVQLGRWRRQFTVNVATSCGANSVAAGTLTMPKNHTEGDIPRIGILTGGYDPLECVLRKTGVQDSEFTNPGGAGHIQLYLAQQASASQADSDFARCPYNPLGSGAEINASTPGQATLFGTTGGQPNIDQYDLVVLACEGYEENNEANWSQLGAYTSAGGRVFATDFAYNWLADGAFSSPPYNVNPAYANVAAWDLAQNPGGSADTGEIDLVSNPKGMAFEQWLQNVGASAPGSGTVSLDPVYQNSNGVVAPTQRWLYSATTGAPIHFTFNTPVGGTSATQCGRVVFSDWHADNLSFPAGFAACGLPTGNAPFYSHNLTFPAECDSNPMTAQEAIIEFMLFDLTACVQPYVPLCTPTTCNAQGIDCGPASDGCGNLLQCGSCATGTCGGGGAGKCGTMTTCTPETCTGQGIQCGQAGDGCGNIINCGNCPTGQICGLNGPGKCGTPTQ